MKIQICNWRKCKWNFSEYIEKRLLSDIEKYNLKNIIVEKCMCLWQCDKWPNVIFDWKIINYSDPIKISKMMFDKKIINNN